MQVFKISNTRNLCFLVLVLLVLKMVVIWVSILHRYRRILTQVLESQPLAFPVAYIIHWLTPSIRVRAGASKRNQPVSKFPFHFALTGSGSTRQDHNAHNFFLRKLIRGQIRCSRLDVAMEGDRPCCTTTIEWFSWLAEVGMQKHGRLMVTNHLEEDDIEHFDHHLLHSIGVETAKDRLLILTQKNKHIQRRSGQPKALAFQQIAAEAQSAIIERVKSLRIDEVKLLQWMKKTWPLCNRRSLQTRGYLAATAPEPGAGVVADSQRTQLGNELLNSAKDMLWAALYGTGESAVVIHRVERELLVITIPGRKAFVFNFFQAVTEVGALGTWRDPDNRCHDEDEPNMQLQVEYGESASEVVGDAIMVSIHVINLLEVNEVVLYARSSNVEQSTLLTELYFENHKLTAAALPAPAKV